MRSLSFGLLHRTCPCSRYTILIEFTTTHTPLRFNSVFPFPDRTLVGTSASEKLTFAKTFLTSDHDPALFLTHAFSVAVRLRFRIFSNTALAESASPNCLSDSLCKPRRLFAIIRFVCYWPTPVGSCLLYKYCITDFSFVKTFSEIFSTIMAIKKAWHCNFPRNG